MVDGFSDGVLVCRSQTESPEVDGEILVEPALAAPETLIGQFIDVDVIGANEYDLIAKF